MMQATRLLDEIWIMQFPGTLNKVCSCLPRFFMTIEWEDTFVSIYSQNSPQLLFPMCRFEIRILPMICTKSGEQFSLKDAVVLNLTNKQTEERTAQAF